MRIYKDLYLLDADVLAPKLIGKLLCRRTSTGIMRLRITETEAYKGEDDTACHASHGRTGRTDVIYGEGGVAYVYLCYGIHSLLNVVCGPRDYPEAVLIRAAGMYNGPGKLTKALDITRELNREDLSTSDRLWLEDDGFEAEYTEHPRVGIDYACERDRNIKWRFIIKEDKA